MQGLKNTSYYCILLLTFISSYLILGESLYSQNRLTPLNHSFDLRIDQAVVQSGRIHSAFQPYSEEDLRRGGLKADSLSAFFSVSKRKDLSGISRKLFHEHLLILDSPNVKLTLDPIYHFNYTHLLDGDDNPYYTNTRGFMLQLQISDNFSVGSSFLENQARLPDYIANRVEFTDVAYGQGRVKRIDTSFYDFSMSSAYLSYSPAHFINITLGHGKHFIGNGYRSHLLSDLAFNYPYLKLKTNWWDGKIQYQNLYALFQDLERVPSRSNSEELFERKLSAIHYLSIMPHPKLEIGLFESNIWPSLDSSGKEEIPVSSYLPLIYLNSLIGDEDQILASNLGLNISYKLLSKLELYSQIASRDLDEGLTSYQFGFSLYPMEGLRIGLELNSNEFDSTAQYSHYNEGLALPYVSQQDEIILNAQYIYERWSVQARVNLFNGDVDQRFVMGELAYMLNPSVQSNFFFNATHRDIDDELFISFGWRTSLQNLYFNY